MEKRGSLLKIKGRIAPFLLIMVFSFSPLHLPFNPAERLVNIAGLVVDASSLTPLDSAYLYDGNNRLLGVTDGNGYYKISFEYQGKDSGRFQYKIVRKDYRTHVQSENWGGEEKPVNIVEFFGMVRQGRDESSTQGFTTLSDNSDLDYASVLRDFKGVVEDRRFEDQLAKAKKGNENVFFSIGGNYYIADKDGWIRIDSGHDMILLNGHRIIRADNLNAVIRRKDITFMGPLDSSVQAKFAITTR